VVAGIARGGVERRTIDELLRLLDSRTPATAAHSSRVCRYALKLAEAFPELDGPTLEPAFLLHDVGKLLIPPAIIEKPCALTPAERKIVETHPVLGEELVRASGLDEAAVLVRSHHEHWDGSGYPDRLEGPEIPLEARVFAVADAFDAMTSTRPYRGARTWDAATTELRRSAGGQFDPEAVDAFFGRRRELFELYSAYTSSNAAVAGGSGRVWAHSSADATSASARS